MRRTYVATKIFFLFLVLPFARLNAHNYNGAHKIDNLVIDTRINSKKDCLTAYQNLITQMPIYLSDIIFCRRWPSFTIIVPDTIDGVGPLDAQAPYIEGARTALAWIQSYEKLLLENQITYTIVKESEYSQEMEKETQSRGLFASTCLNKEKELAIESPMIMNPPWGFDCSKKTVLLTGGAGFIGSHLTRKLLVSGYRVMVIDNLTCSTGTNISDLSNNPDFFFVNHDVCQPFSISAHIDCIVHGASVPSPADYYRMPRETMRAGLMGTMNTLLLSIQHNARYLFMSTSEVYGDPEVHPQVESYAGNVNCMCSRSPYDQSKRGAETLIKLSYEKYHPDVRIARIFNTYGPGMRLHDGRVVTNFTAALLENRPMLFYGSGLQTRSMCYVDDMVEGLYGLLVYDKFGPADPITDRVFNLGNPEEFSIQQIAHEFERLSVKYLSHSTPCQNVESSDKADPRKRRPDISRASEILGFVPKVPFAQGLEKTFLYFL